MIRKPKVPTTKNNDNIRIKTEERGQVAQSCKLTRGVPEWPPRAQVSHRQERVKFKRNGKRQHYANSETHLDQHTY